MSSTDNDHSRPEMDYHEDMGHSLNLDGSCDTCDANARAKAMATELHTDAEWKQLRQERTDAQNLARLESARRQAAQDRLKAMTSISYDRAINPNGLNPDALIGTKVHLMVEEMNQLDNAAQATTGKVSDLASKLRASALQNSGRMGVPPTPFQSAWPQAGQPITLAKLAEAVQASNPGPFVDLAAHGHSYVNLLLSPEGQPLARLNPDLEIEQELPMDLVLSVQMRPVAVGQMMWQCLLCGALVLDQHQHQQWHESILVKNFQLYTDHVLPAGPEIQENPV